MTGDLGTGKGEVHGEAIRLLDFWFGLSPQQHFARDERLDAEIAQRFGMLRDRLLVTGAEGWRDEPDTLLAAIVALDQFSRNIHLGTARADEGDPLALALTRLALVEGWEDRYARERRVFLYMPLMHAEDADTQRLSVDRFGALGEPANLKFAREHAEVVELYGRFPSRNAALGRVSTAAEQTYLSRPDAGW